MPFIVQCPYRNCRKYMLLEDSVRGAKVECLVCRKPIEVASSGSGERPQTPPPPPQASAPAATPPPTTRRETIATCPSCSAPLRLPPSHHGRSIRCPRCSHVFVG